MDPVSQPKKTKPKIKPQVIFSASAAALPAAVLRPLIGTSGWYYEGWSQPSVPGYGSFYKGKPDLSHYATRFKFVELNAPFYRTPTVSTVKSWYDAVPRDFRFLVKVNQSMTQYKKLIDWEEKFAEFYKVLSNLKDKLAGFLIQLPHQFGFSEANLERVIRVAEHSNRQYKDIDFYIEFRCREWFCERVYSALRGRLHVVCVHTNNIKQGFVLMDRGFSGIDADPIKRMFRLHGTWDSMAYSGSYNDSDIAIIASLNPDIVAFDNTDTVEDEIDVEAHLGFFLPGKRGFPTFTLAKADKILLPAAIADALKLSEAMGL